MVKKLSILMYHQIGEFKGVKTHKATYCHVRRFAFQMAYLYHMGYQTFSLEAALAGLKGERELPEKAVVLTFDDGYRNFELYAFPILKRYGFTATVYLIAKMVGKNAEWLAKEGHAPAPLLDRDAVLRLQDEGIAFGSHACSHERLTTLDRRTARQEIFESKAVLEDLLRAPVSHFCYPYGDHDLACLEMVREAGYSTAVTCLKAAATESFDAHALPRKAVSLGDSVLGFWWKLHSKDRAKHPPIVSESILCSLPFMLL